jgi:hypothetical protein
MNLDFNSKSLLSDRMNTIIDQAMEWEQKKEMPRNYLGASSLGVECDRALQFKYFNTPKDQGKTFSGRILRIFQRGHWAEEYITGVIRDAGFDLRTGTQNGEQFGFSVLDGKIQGHIDGVFGNFNIIVNIPYQRIHTIFICFKHSYICLYCFT